MFLSSQLPVIMPGGPGQTETLAKCLGTELNRRRRPFQGRALPTELPRLENLIKLTEERRTRKDRNWKCCGTLNQSCETNAGVARDIEACVLTAFRHE